MRAFVLALSAIMALAEPTTARPRPAPAIVVSGAQVRASLGGSANSAAYLIIENRGGRADRLMSVACDCADQAEVHVSRMSGAMMSMEPAGPVVIPPHGRVAFRPGGLHIMLTGVRRPLADGARQTMTLRFEQAGPMRVVFQVRERILDSQDAPMGGMHH